MRSRVALLAVLALAALALAACGSSEETSTSTSTSPFSSKAEGNQPGTETQVGAKQLEAQRKRIAAFEASGYAAQQGAQPDANPKAGCLPGYEPCVPPYPRDPKCADLPGPISVIGKDTLHLDSDGDGVACDRAAGYTP